MPFERKLECIARNIVAGSEAVIMLMHSWSFSDYYIQTGHYGTLAKRCHYKFSQQALDELRYLAEFIRMTERAELVNIRELCQSHKRQPYRKASNKNHTDLVDVCGETIHIPVSRMPPQYGKLRGLCEEGFLNLDEGKFFSSDMMQTLSVKKMHEIDIFLPEKKQPRAGDFTKVFFCVPSRKNKWYKISMVLDCPYYKEKYQGRNSIRYFVRINGEEVFSNYITNPDRDEYIEHAVKAAGHTIEIFIGLECLADEKPWGWGTCARTTIKGIHVSVI